MNKVFFILVISFFSSGIMYAQGNAISTHFSNYQRDTSFTKVSVTSKMFNLFMEIEGDDEDTQELLEAIGKLKGIKGIIKNDDGKNNTDLYYNAVDKIVKDGTYEELMSVEDASENAQFFVRESNDVINELLMVVGGKTQFVVMSLFGEIDLNAIIHLSKVMKIKGFEGFQHLDKEK